MAITGAPGHAVADTAVTRGRGRLAQQLRADAVHASAMAGSGHPASSMSAAELMAVLLDGHLRLGPPDPQDRRCDHLIFSRGRAWPLYYAMLKAAGATGDEAPADVVTGSTGPGLPIGIGLALAGGAEPVDVDDHGQVSQRRPAAVAERLPGGDLGHLAVSAQHPDPAGQPV